MPDYVDKAREAQQQHEQKHDVQQELEYSYTHCSECGGETDGEGWCPNYCMEGEK